MQPVVYANFHWHPDGFFDENPALDVPPGGGVEFFVLRAMHTTDSVVPAVLQSQSRLITARSIEMV